MNLAIYRNLDTPMFRETALKMGSKLHGATWVREVFALAGFRDTVFHAALEHEDMTVKKFLTSEEKARIISLVIRVATEATVDKGGYKWTHKQYGEGATRNRNEVVGKCLSISIKKKGLLILEGDVTILTDPMDDKVLIVRQGALDGAVKKLDVIGFWSNWMQSPVKVQPQIDDVFVDLFVK